MVVSWKKKGKKKDGYSIDFIKEKIYIYILISLKS